MNVNPYLVFEGRCEEALEFYKRAVGAEVTTLMRLKDGPEAASVPKGSENKIMHAEVRIGTATVFATDGMCPSGGFKNSPTYDGFSLTLTVPSESEAERIFNKLADNGAVRMPLERTFFAARFGMLSDPFGVPWIVVTEK